MASKSIVLRRMFEPVVEAMGYQLWGLEYLPQGRHSLLRIYIDKEGGIDVEDCAEVSHQLSGLLDVEDPISGEYTLEVSSPGLDRPLFTPEQFKAYIGQQAKVRLKQAFDNRKNFTGVIKGVEDDEIILGVGEEDYTLPIEAIDKANIVTQFE